MIKLILYGTDYCHLCDEAEALLSQFPDGVLYVQKSDIANDDELLEQYGVRIPVVRSEGTDRELGWPFDLVQLQDFIDSLSD